MNKCLFGFALMLISSVSYSGWFGPDSYAECMSEALEGKTGQSLVYAKQAGEQECFNNHCKGETEKVRVRSRQQAENCKEMTEPDGNGIYCVEFLPKYKDNTCPPYSDDFVETVKVRLSIEKMLRENREGGMSIQEWYDSYIIGK